MPSKPPRTDAVVAAILSLPGLSAADIAMSQVDNAELGRGQEQIVAASRGEAVPCQAGIPACMPTDNASGTRTWHDQRRGTIITAIAAGSGTRLIYRPSAG